MKRAAVSIFALGFVIALAARAASAPAPLILVSMDGFRWDYCERYPGRTPHLQKLRRDGVSARGLVPVFPSNTFPNHYSIVTGLYPAHHGIINNQMFDPVRGEFFRYNTAKSSGESWWWGGEPVWITAVKQGRRAAAIYWPGSETEIGGVRPTHWRRFDYFDVSFAARLDELVGWFRRPATERPALATFYFEEANNVGHNFGPDSPEIAAAVGKLDAQFAELRTRLESEGIVANYVIVSDHGMAAVAPGSPLILDDYLDLAAVQIDDFGSSVGLRPRTSDVAGLERALARMPHAKVYRAENLPAHFQLRNNPRIPPLWILPDEGWRAETRAFSQQPRRSGPVRGDHGYDPALPSMRGILIAQGPAFKRGVELPEVENIHIYNLLCAVLGLKAAPNDGDDRLVKAALR